MRTFVESLKRLYKQKRIDKEKVDSLRSKLTDEEYNYILGEV